MAGGDNHNLKYFILYAIWREHRYQKHVKQAEARRNPKPKVPVTYAVWILSGLFLTAITFPIIWCIWYLGAGKFIGIVWLTFVWLICLTGCAFRHKELKAWRRS